MIRNKKDNQGPIVIDLTGPEGNVFVLMAYAERFAKQIGLDPEGIINKMMEGDYENAIQVFDMNFGEFVILER